MIIKLNFNFILHPVYLWILVNIAAIVTLVVTSYSKKTPMRCHIRAVCIFILLLQGLAYTPATTFFKFPSFWVFLMLLSWVLAIWYGLFRAIPYLGVTCVCFWCLFHGYEMLAIGYQTQVWYTILPFLKTCGWKYNFVFSSILIGNCELITFILLVLFILLAYWLLSQSFPNLSWFTRLVLAIGVVFLLSCVIYMWNRQYLSCLTTGRIFIWMNIRYVITPMAKMCMHVDTWWRRFYIWAALRESPLARWVYRLIVLWCWKR